MKNEDLAPVHEEVVWVHNECWFKPGQYALDIAGNGPAVCAICKLAGDKEDGMSAIWNHWLTRRLLRFNYYDGKKWVYTGAVKKITGKDRAIADAGGISVFQGIKLKRILGFEFNQVRPGWWVLLCFESQREIGEMLFDKRVEKLKRRKRRYAV